MKICKSCGDPIKPSRSSEYCSFGCSILSTCDIEGSMSTVTISHKAAPNTIADVPDGAFFRFVDDDYNKSGALFQKIPSHFPGGGYYIKSWASMTPFIVFDEDGKCLGINGRFSTAEVVLLSFTLTVEF